jgi:hypothetical protein
VYTYFITSINIQMTFRLAGFGVKKFGQRGGKGIGMFDEGPESIFTTIRIYLALRSLPIRHGAQVCGRRPDFSQKMHSGGFFWLLF